MNKTLFVLLCVLGASGCDRGETPAPSASPPASPPVINTTVTNSNPPATLPDNTGINTRDRAADALTAGMTGQTKSDVDLAANIRRQVTSANVSINARNCKIVVQAGKVTLRGPVNTPDEKDQIGRIAVAAAGAENVDNQLEVQPNP